MFLLKKVRTGVVLRGELRVSTLMLWMDLLNLHSFIFLCLSVSYLSTFQWSVKRFEFALVLGYFMSVFAFIIAYSKHVCRTMLFEHYYVAFPGLMKLNSAAFGLYT